jgi:hypothetical protein
VRTDKEAMVTAINNWLQSFDESDDIVPLVVSFVNNEQHRKIQVMVDNDFKRNYSYSKGEL